MELFDRINSSQDLRIFQQENSFAWYFRGMSKSGFPDRESCLLGWIEWVCTLIDGVEEDD